MSSVIRDAFNHSAFHLQDVYYIAVQRTMFAHTLGHQAKIFTRPAVDRNRIRRMDILVAI